MSYPRRFVFGLEQRARSTSAGAARIRTLRRRRSFRVEHLEARLALVADLAQLLAAPAIDNSSMPAEVTKTIVPGVIVVAFEGDQDPIALQSQLSNSLQLARLDLKGSVQSSHLFTVEDEVNGIQTLLTLRLGAEQDVLAAEKVIEELPGVAWAQPDYSYGGRPVKEYIPNDPFYPLQYHHGLVQNPTAWNTTLGDPTTIVAVADDGVQMNHPDLVANLYVDANEIPNNLIDDDGNGYVDDVSGWDFVTGDNNPSPAVVSDDHGTHIAGIIAATADNLLGVAGVAPNARIMPLRFFGADGGFTSLIISQTYRYAADNGADIVNTSYNIDSFVGDAIFTAALQYMYNRGVLIINAAGNNNELNPARQAFTQTLLVSSVGPSDTRSFDSNYGTGIDISAPGEDILSTITLDRYDEYSGSSMAAAVASGVAALIISSRPPPPVPPPFPPPPIPYTRDQVAALLVGTATDIDLQNPTVTGLLGSGRVNSNAALNDPLPPVQINRLNEVPTTLNPTIFPISRLTASLEGVFSKATVESVVSWRLASAGTDGVLGTPDDQAVTLTRTAPYFIGANEISFTFPTLAPGQYRFTGFSANIRNPFNIPMDGDANGLAGGNYIKDFRVTNGTAVFSADFSDATGAPSDEGFISGGTGNQWHLSTGRGANPGHSTDDSFYFGAGETATGGGQYANSVFGILQSPSINLTTFGAPLALEFNHFLRSQAGDFASVYVFDGASFTEIARSGGLLPSNTTGFQSVRLDLSSYAGKNIELYFVFSSNNNTVDEGWYIDDVTVLALVGGSISSIAGVVYQDNDGDANLDGGEPGLGGWTTYIDVNNNGQLDNNLLLDSPSTDTPINIVDSTVITSFLTVADITGVISDLNITLNIDHTFAEDLDVFLVTPQGARIELFTDVGGSLDNFTNLVLDDEAPNSIAAGVAPFTGSYQPEGQLSVLDGLSPNGTWRLQITDDHAPDAGRLLNWSLNFTSSEPTSITDNNGNYQFAGLLAGTYIIREVLLPGHTPTEPVGGSYSVTVAAGQFAPNFDFGNAVIPTEIRGTVWNDLNGNRIREAGENGQSGWTVFLDANNNGIFDSVTPTLDSQDAPKNIIDFTTITSQLIVNGLGGVILDANVSLNILHPWDADLDIFLVSPTGIRVELTTDNGPGAANFTGTVFNDEASTSITTGTAPYTGNFRPETPLSVLDGTDANGVWRLEITDDTGSAQGTLTGWSLQLNVAESSTTTSATGDYVFGNLTPGTYIVREVVQPTWKQVLPVSGFHSAVVLNRQTTAGQDFANTQGNSAPLISDVPNQTLPEDSSAVLNFTINDIETPVAFLTLSATSSDPAILPISNIVFGGAFGNRTVTLTPLPNQFGPVTVTLIVTDGAGKTVQDTFVLNVTPVNDAPTFVRGSNQNTGVNSGPQSVTNWATAILPGPFNEAGQTVSFVINNNTNSGLFAVQPALAPNGTLTYTPANGAVGSATITVVLQDNGGTAGGGQNTSVPQSFIITIGPPTSLQVAGLTPTRTGFIVDFNNDINPATLNLYDTEGGGIGPVDIIFAGATSGSIRGSAVVDPNLRRLTFVRSVGLMVPDNYSVTLRSAADGFINPVVGQLDGDANGVAGGNFTQTFSIPPYPFGVPLANVSIPSFARGPGQAINVPATASTGIPVTLSDGAGVNSVAFQLQYDPTLLNITGVTMAPGMTSLVTDSTIPGILNVQVGRTGGIGAGPAQVVFLQANVPATAPYLAKQVVNLTSVSFNGGAIPGDDDDGVQSVAYVGDVTGNGTYSALDASKVYRAAVGLDSGFAAFKLLDPLIIGDVTANADISATDTSRIMQAAVAVSVPEIPALPLPAVSLLFGGPDPKLSVPADLTALPGGSLEIPVMIDSIVDLTGNGLESGDLVLYYDAAVLDVTSVSLGGLLSARGSWSIASRIDPLAGRIFISVAGNTPLEGTFQGEFVTLQALVKDNAPLGATAINLAAGSRDPARSTQLNEGYLTLIPAPTDASNDPGVDGVLTILPSAAQLAEQPLARLVDNQLVVIGTSASDRLIIGAIGEDRMRVRAGNQVLGDFSLPASVAIDSGGGDDYIVLAANIPLAARARAADLIFSAGPVALVEADAADGSAKDGVSVQDEALLQLLAVWQDGATMQPTSAVPGRFVRYGRR
jgi:subtilisin family serine protease/subtilisin-like proprotein convertase family protein